MSLEPYQGDDAMRQLHAERTRKLNGVTLGPDSPLRAEATRSKKAGGPKPHPGSAGTLKYEHDIQAEVFRWVDNPSNQMQHPELAVYYAIPNGGHMMPAVAAKRKAEGVKPGVLDTHLPVARGGYHSLYIEIKRPGSTLKPEQPYWLSALARYGNKVAIHTTAEGAIAELLEYLALPKP